MRLRSVCVTSRSCSLVKPRYLSSRALVASTKGFASFIRAWVPPPNMVLRDIIRGNTITQTSNFIKKKHRRIGAFSFERMSTRSTAKLAQKLAALLCSFFLLCCFFLLCHNSFCDFHRRLFFTSFDRSGSAPRTTLHEQFDALS